MDKTTRPKCCRAGHDIIDVRSRITNTSSSGEILTTWEIRLACKGIRS